MCVLLVMSVALSAEPPERPEPSEPAPKQCPGAVAIIEGDTSICRGVLLPTSWMADYEKLSVHTDYLERLYRIDTTALEHELQYTQRLLEYAQKPEPVWEKPAFWTGVGIVLGSAAVVGGGYAMGASRGVSNAY